LSDVVRVDVFNPRTVDCVISPSPKRINQGNERGLPIELLEGETCGKKTMIIGRYVLGRALRLAEVIVGGRDGVCSASPICSQNRKVGLSANVRVFGRNAREHVEISFLDVSSNKAGELDLHSKRASNGGEIVAPLWYSQKTVGGARSPSLKRDVRNPSGQPIIREDETETIRGSGC
jgi:hypothetical protein